jgi:hypothetical protein
MSGVTTIQRSRRSTPGGMRTLPWLNIEVALSKASKINTANRGCAYRNDHRRLDHERQQNLDRVEAQLGEPQGKRPVVRPSGLQSR